MPELKVRELLIGQMETSDTDFRFDDYFDLYRWQLRAHDISGKVCIRLTFPAGTPKQTPSYRKAIFRIVALLHFISLVTDIKQANYPGDDTIPLRIYLGGCLCLITQHVRVMFPPC